MRFYPLYPKYMAPSVTFMLCPSTSGHLLTFLDAMPPIFFVLPLLDVASSGSWRYACLPYVSSCHQFTIEFPLIYHILCGFGDLSYYYSLTATLSMAILLGPIWASHPMSNSTLVLIPLQKQTTSMRIMMNMWLGHDLLFTQSSLSLPAPGNTCKKINKFMALLGQAWSQWPVSCWSFTYSLLLLELRY